MKHRIGRVEAQVQREIDDILLKEVNDPRVKGVTITGIKLTGDLQEATVYYSTLSDDEQVVADTQVGLDKAKGLIRKEVASRLSIFRVPTLTFVRDTSVQYGAHIDKLLNEMRNKQ